MQNLLTEEHSSIEELTTLVRSVTKDEVVFLLQKKYEVTDLDKPNLDDLVVVIERHTDSTDIIQDLSTIRSCVKVADEETFRSLCEIYGIKLDFHDSFRKVIIKCLMQKPDYLLTMKTLSAVNKQKDFSVFQGKSVEEQVRLNPSIKGDISKVIGDLIEQTEPGRRYTFKMEQTQSDILLTAYFDKRKKTFTQISSGKKVEVESITIIPALQAQAKYNLAENRLYLKSGQSTKVQNYLLEGLGKAFYKDNNHFLGSNEVYKLDEVKNDEFHLTIDEELSHIIESVSIIEEVLVVELPDQVITLTLKGDDAEGALEYLSNEKVNLKAQPRKSVTLQLIIKQEDGKPKKANITINDNNKISYDPKYADVVHQCLVRWGIEVGANNGS